MTRRPRHNPGIGLDYMAGWLFADMLLVLFLVGVGAEISRASDPPTPQDVITLPKKKYEKLKKDSQELAELKKKSMREKPVCETVAVDTDALLAGGQRGARYDAALAKRLGRDLRSYDSHKAAMILIWGYAQEPNRGEAIAKAIQDPLKAALPGTYGEAGLRPLWRGGPEGKVRLEMYFLGATKGPACTAGS